MRITSDMFGWNSFDEAMFRSTILATVIRFSGTGIRYRVTTIRYSTTGIRFSLHRIPVTRGEQEIEGSKRPAERFTHIRYLPGNAEKSGPKAKKVTTPISYQDQGCDVAKDSYFDTNATRFESCRCNRLQSS